MANLPACGSGMQGRRKRNAGSEPENAYEEYEDKSFIQPTPTIQLVFAGTTISDPMKVDEYLYSSQNENKSLDEATTVAQNYADNTDQGKSDFTTELYPAEDSFFDDETDGVEVTTEVVENDFQASIEDGLNVSNSRYNWRAGILRQTTRTTTISITSVATSVHATDTLTVEYKGCLPSSLPVSGLRCGV